MHGCGASKKKIKIIIDAEWPKDAGPEQREAAKDGVEWRANIRRDEKHAPKVLHHE